MGGVRGVAGNAAREARLLEMMAQGIWEIDAEGRTTFVTSRMAEMLGYTPGEMLGSLLVDHLDEEGRARTAADLGRRSEGSANECEIVIVRKDGTPIWARINSRPIMEDGAFAGAVATVTDITRDRTREATLREVEQQFRLSFDHAPIGKALVAPDGRWLRVNQAICEILGYRSDELLTKTFQDITHPDDLGADLEFVRQMLAGEIRTYALEKRYLHADGRIVWVNLSVSLVRADDGTPIHFISQIEDITGRKADEELLRRSNHLLERTQQLARVGSWEWDVSAGPAGLVRWSAEMYRLHGVDPETFVMSKANVDKLIHPDDFPHWAGQLAQAAASRSDLEGFAYRALHPDGSVHWIWSQGSFDPGQPGVLIGFVQDISERKADEERLEHLALIDELTGLRNRRGFMAVAEPVARMAQRDGRDLALIFIDLDDMKDINDRFGHRAGDRALIDTAELLATTFRSSDIAARMGGDEFCVLLPRSGIEVEADLDRLRERLMGRGASAFPPLSLSVGVAISDSTQPTSIEQLIDLADSDMYSQKNLKKSRSSVGAS